MKYSLIKVWCSPVHELDWAELDLVQLMLFNYCAKKPSQDPPTGLKDSPNQAHLQKTHTIVLNVWSSSSHSNGVRKLSLNMAHTPKIEPTSTPERAEPW